MWKSTSAPILWTLLTVLLLTACQPIRPDQDASADTEQTTAAAAEQTELTEPATPTPEPPSTLLTLQPASSGEARTAAEIFTAISPAVAFVDTPSGTGSGILIQDGYLLTNAHVVWPYAQVRIVFPDGSQHLVAPVVGWDLIADLALVGPIETQIEPVPLVDAAELPIGSDVYLIGYPAEEEAFPQPAMTNGILSRLRNWETIDYTFFQVDAATIEGQSGGVMVTHAGDVVGISTFTFSGFGLAGSVADALPRLNTILGHELCVTIADRSFPHGDGPRVFEDTLRDENDLRRYILRQAPGAEVEISVEGVGWPQLFVQSLGGDHLEGTESQDPEQKQATLNFTVEFGEPYIVEVHQPSENENSFVLTSSHSLLAFPDPDDSRVLAVGESYLGTLDIPGDVDVFELELKAGQRIRIDVDSIGIDPWIALAYEGDTLEEIVTADDSGGGLFGENSRIVYQAPRDGAYLLLVEDFAEVSVGSYFVNVTVPTDAAQLTEPDVSRFLLPTGYGKMGWYESEENGFSILEPIEWEPLGEDVCPATACYASSIASYTLLEIPTHDMQQQDRAREGYVPLLDEGMSNRPGVSKLSAETLTTVQGLTADRLDYITGAGGRSRLTVFVYVDEPAKAVLVLLLGTPTNRYPLVEPLIELFIDSFRYWETDEREHSAVFHLDEGWRLAATNAVEEALDAYTRSIELDPELMQAYRSRGTLLVGLGRYEEASVDLNKALELAPDDTQILALRSVSSWSQGLDDQALAEINHAIELIPDYAEFYNVRSLILAGIGEYDSALADIDKTIGLHDGQLLPNIQDSRGFIYLKMGDLENARADYQAILDQDLRFAYALLGAGVVCGQLGDEEKAAMLIDEAMEQLEEEERSLMAPNPQLAALLEMAEEFSGEEVNSQ